MAVKQKQKRQLSFEKALISARAIQFELASKQAQLKQLGRFEDIGQGFLQISLGGSKSVWSGLSGRPTVNWCSSSLQRIENFAIKVQVALISGDEFEYPSNRLFSEKSNSYIAALEAALQRINTSSESSLFQQSKTQRSEDASFQIRRRLRQRIVFLVKLTRNWTSNSSDSIRKLISIFFVRVPVFDEDAFIHLHLRKCFLTVIKKSNANGTPENHQAAKVYSG